MKNFFVNYRRRFNLEEVLQEWEAEQGTQGSSGEHGAPTGEEAKRSANTPSGKSTDEEDEEVAVSMLAFSIFILTIYYKKTRR